MTLIVFKSIEQFFSRVLELKLYEIPHFRFRLFTLFRKNSILLLGVSMSGCMMLICPIVGDANLDHFVKMVPPNYLHYKVVPFYPNVISGASIKINM